MSVHAWRIFFPLIIHFGTNIHLSDGFVLNEQIQVLLIYISKWFPTHTYTHTYECSMTQWTQKVVLNLKFGYTSWCKWLLNESWFLWHKMFLEKYFSLNAIMCSHWSEGTISRNTQTLNQDCISQTRTNPATNVCSPTAYRSEATLRHEKWHKRFNVALWNRVSLELKRQTLRVGCAVNAVGEGPCVSCEVLHVHQMETGPSCVPNRPLTISRHT